MGGLIMKYPIRVLQVVTYMGRGGLETMLMNYYRHIDRSKVQFDFLVHRDFEADYDKEILELGGRIYHIDRLIPWSKDYKNKLIKFFNDHDEYKIVHVHQDCLSSVALECAKKCNVPVRIAHSHNSNQDKNLKYPIKLFYRKRIPNVATDLFACSQSSGEWMFGEHNFRVLKNAINTESYIYNSVTASKIKIELGLEDSFVIGHVGLFRPQKNHPFIIDIFNECKNLDSSSKLILIGDGEGRQDIEELVKSKGLENDVIFMGIQENVNELLQAMDVFLFPSLYEGLSVALLEAEAAGLPCFISDSISDECIVTKGLIEKTSLNTSPKIWAQKIVDKKNFQRTDTRNELKMAGYDIVESSKQLENYYLNSYKKTVGEE